MTTTFGLLALASTAFLVGFLVREDFEEWLARRRYRCEVCGSRTNDEGVGHEAALESSEEGSS